MLLIYIGIVLLSLGSKPLTKALGIFSGGLAIVATILTLVFPNVSIFLQITSILPYAWTLWVAIYKIMMVRKERVQ